MSSSKKKHAVVLKTPAPVKAVPKPSNKADKKAGKRKGAKPISTPTGTRKGTAVKKKKAREQIGDLMEKLMRSNKGYLIAVFQEKPELGSVDMDWISSDFRVGNFEPSVQLLAEQLSKEALKILGNNPPPPTVVTAPTSGETLAGDVVQPANLADVLKLPTTEEVVNAAQNSEPVGSDVYNAGVDTLPAAVKETLADGTELTTVLTNNPTPGATGKDFDEEAEFKNADAGGSLGSGIVEVHEITEPRTYEQAPAPHEAIAPTPEPESSGGSSSSDSASVAD